MIEVNEGLTRQVAHLARLELTAEEVKTFTSQLGDIIRYVETLQQVKVDGVEPLTHPLDLATPMRADEVRELPRDAQGHSKILACAPEVIDNGFKVPPIL